MQTQSTSWAYTRLLANSPPWPRETPGHGLEQRIDGSEGDRFVSISLPGWVVTSPGELPVKLLGKLPEGLDQGDGMVLHSLIHNDVQIENQLRLTSSFPDRPKPDGQANIGLARQRVDHYQELLQADNKSLLAQKFFEARLLLELHQESWKTRLLAVSVAGGLAVMGGGMLLGFSGAPVALAGLAATVATGALVGKPLADRWLESRCAQDLRQGMREPLAYWEDQLALRTEVNRRLKSETLQGIPLPPTPLAAVEVKENAVVVGGVQVKRKTTDLPERR